MPLFQGVNAVDSVFNGTTEVERIYQGANLLFQSAAFSQPAPAVSGYLSDWEAQSLPSVALHVDTSFLEWESQFVGSTGQVITVPVDTNTDYEFITDSDAGLNISDSIALLVGTTFAGNQLGQLNITQVNWAAGGPHTLAFNSGANTTVFCQIRKNGAFTGQMRFNNTFVREA